jgi:xanthine dehydrogenase accessory factor
MTDALLEELTAARRDRISCALATVAETKGSVPRAAGAKMLVYANGKISGTIGGGKFEALVVEDAQRTMRDGKPLLKTYPLREGEPDSFGAVCGGESTVLIEPQNLNSALFLVGGGHCSLAIAKLALECGMPVSVIEERADLLAGFPAAANCVTADPNAFIASREWKNDEALLLVSRNHDLDREALASALMKEGFGYIGMIGSRRKVRKVFDALLQRGIPAEKLAQVYSPVGLDIGADSPTEIAISALAEILKVQRQRSGAQLRQG